MSSFADDLTRLCECLDCAPLVAGDVVMQEHELALAEARAIIQRIVRAPKPPGPDAPSEVRII